MGMSLITVRNSISRGHRLPLVGLLNTQVTAYWLLGSLRHFVRDFSGKSGSMRWLFQLFYSMINYTGGVYDTSELKDDSVNLASTTGKCHQLCLGGQPAMESMLTGI